MCVPAWEGSNKPTPWLHPVIWCTAWCHCGHTPLLSTSLMETKAVNTALMRSYALMQVGCMGCYWLDILCANDRMYGVFFLKSLSTDACWFHLVFVVSAYISSHASTQRLIPSSDCPHSVTSSGFQHFFPHSICEKLPVAFYSSVWPTVEPESAEKRSIYPQRWMLAPSKWTIRKEHNLRRDRRVMEHSLKPFCIHWLKGLRHWGHVWENNCNKDRRISRFMCSRNGGKEPRCSVRRLLIANDNMENDAGGSAAMFLCVWDGRGVFLVWM